MANHTDFYQQGRQDEQVQPDDGPLQPVPDVRIGIGPRRQISRQQRSHQIIQRIEGPAHVLQDGRRKEKADDRQVDDDDHQPEPHRRRLTAVIQVSQPGAQSQAVVLGVGFGVGHAGFRDAGMRLYGLHDPSFRQDERRRQ